MWQRKCEVKTTEKEVLGCTKCIACVGGINYHLLQSSSHVKGSRNFIESNWSCGKYAALSSK
jgi:hypothetical protein